MTAILGYTNLLLEDDSFNHDLVRRDDAACTIQRNGDHLLGIVNDILNLSKIEAAKLNVESIVFSPRDLIDDVLSLMQIRAQAKGIALQSQFETLIPDKCIGNPTRLRQILTR